jgi:hypothetical protein
LLFVYNADSGMFNTLADIGHKLFSPQTYECALCALTHGYFRERGQWRDFVESLDCECRFLHRDQFTALYPQVSSPLPAVFTLNGDLPTCCADADSIAACSDLSALQQMLRDRCCQTAEGGKAPADSDSKACT